MAEGTVRGIEQNPTGGQHNPEIELLLRCARTRRCSEGAPQLKALLQEDLDWPYLISMAQRHRIVPLLFWHLDNASPGAVPEAYLTGLRRHFRSNSLRNLLLTGELLKLYEHFEQNDIFAIPYKGPTLAASVYRNLALRQAGDLDILVDRCDVLKTKELLLSLGYEPTPWRAVDQLSAAQESAFLRFEREYAFWHEGAGISVEIQWEVIPRYFSFSWDLVSLRQRRQRVSLGGGAVRTFVPEDLLLVLCVHGSKHFWERLAWVCDVGETVNLFHDMNWDDLMARAAALGSERMVLLGLFLAHGLLHAHVPMKLLDRARADPAVERLAKDACRRLFSGSDDMVENPDDWSVFHPFHYRMRERWRDRLGYVLLKVAEPNAADWMEHPLPEKLFPLYYVLRPLRLIRKFGWGLLKSIQGKRY